MNEVPYMIGLKKDVDADKAISELENLASDLNLTKLNLGFGTYLTGHTEQDTYEKLFDCELKMKTFTINNQVGRPQTVHEWEEKTLSKVPKGLENYIKSVELQHQMYPCKNN